MIEYLAVSVEMVARIADLVVDNFAAAVKCLLVQDSTLLGELVGIKRRLALMLSSKETSVE